MVDVLTYMGIIAFAISGALTAIKNKMDWFGVIVLGNTCAFAGGLLRDIILNKDMPWMFENWKYLLVGIIFSALCLIPKFNQRFNGINVALIMMDTIGISVFSVIGAQAVIGQGNIFYTIFIGTITAVGGGVTCDLFADQKPRIFVNDFYATSCIIGIVVMCGIWKINSNYAMIAGAITVMAIRFLAIKFKWNQPKENKS